MPDPHPSAPVHTHSHRPTRSPGPSASLLTRGAAPRLAVAGVLCALLWMAVAWALA